MTPTAVVIEPTGNLCNSSKISFKFKGINTLSYSLTIYTDSAKQSIIGTYSEDQFYKKDGVRSISLNITNGTYYYEISTIRDNNREFIASNSFTVNPIAVILNGLTDDSHLCSSSPVNLSWNAIGYGSYEVEMDYNGTVKNIETDTNKVVWDDKKRRYC